MGTVQALHLSDQEAHMLTVLALSSTAHHEAIHRALQCRFGQYRVHLLIKSGFDGALMRTSACLNKPALGVA